MGEFVGLLSQLMLTEAIPLCFLTSVFQVTLTSLLQWFSKFTLKRDVIVILRCCRFLVCLKTDQIH